MSKLLIIASLTVLVLLVSEVSAKCCGRGKHGYCNDCARVGLLLHRKCCGSGSGHGYGCNVFCCSCGSCRSGHPTITYQSGWLTNKKYSCKESDKDSESADLFSLRDTWDVFNNIDQNADAAISPDEFLHAIRLRLSDEENGHIMASHLLKSQDVDEVSSLLDAVSDDEMNRNDAEDFLRMAADEFNNLDKDGDGLIQAQEFDDDLKA